MKTNERATGADGDRVTAGKLMVDMKVLAADTGQLLKATGGQTGQFIGQVRADAQESLKAARARVADLSDVALAKTRIPSILRTVRSKPPTHTTPAPWQHPARLDSQTAYKVSIFE
jgi:ElaB/YqjD/DUF883 family membrane-anchored ribosome-binding protein